MKKLQKLLIKDFQNHFGGKPQVLVCAPGRINIIGEHTDYNDGFVLPIAIDKRIYAAASYSGDETVTLCSANMRGEVVFRLSAIQPCGDWGDYPKGIVAKLAERKYPLKGFYAFFISDLPIGAGVSSSAAMEVAVCYLLQALEDFSLSPVEAAILCQQAEHSFSGTRCGIMDQFISVMGRKDDALLLDCRTLDYQYVPLVLGDYALVACDSRVERGLVDSEYNKRRAECEEGVGLLSRRFEGVRALRDVNLSQLQKVSADLSETVFRRCRHVVTENERVATAVEMMSARNWSGLGKLMNQSHDSLRDDYEVSCRQLDFLVESAREIQGVMGARLTGAGFGGCTINLVHHSAIQEFEATISEKYLEKFDVVPRMFICSPSDGAHTMHAATRKPD